MFDRLPGFMAGILLAGFLTSAAWAQSTPAAAEPNWKDQGESDIGLAAENEKDPAKQFDLLNKWEQQYPNSDFRNLRTLLTANALLNIIGPTFAKTDTASLDAGQKAARQLVDHFNTYFGPEVQPATSSDDKWAGVKETA